MTETKAPRPPTVVAPRHLLVAAVVISAVASLTIGTSWQFLDETFTSNLFLLIAPVLLLAVMAAPRRQPIRYSDFMEG